MKVSVHQLETGTILGEDIITLSKYPLMTKQTLLNNELIDILKAFLIQEVEIEKAPCGGEAKSDAKTNEKQERDLKTTRFQDQYNQAVTSFKKLYTGWQSGAIVDIVKVRNLILPLIKEGLHHPEEIFKTPYYAQVKEYIYHHCISVSLLSAFLAQRLNFPQGEINQIAITGLLCDAGMTKMEPTILWKKLALTDKEFTEIKQHPVLSYKMIKELTAIKEGVKIGVLQHHERLDGSGYPLGAKGEQLHPYGKIVAVADTYQAMVCERPYRPKMSPFKVLEQIRQDQFGKFDLSTTNVLTKAIVKTSNGAKVRLSDGRYAEVVFVEQQYPTRPMVKLIDTQEIIALASRKDMYIEEII
ncbi:HD-GYP domain-containing protein [Metabacillus sp. RGM 3146]|uniref:HD-GYP domain-containing protein n=1 Tax=Metabacillus sp. RGM 3146 TaxID=3401092 RepID=UPI003B9CBE44